MGSVTAFYSAADAYMYAPGRAATDTRYRPSLRGGSDNDNEYDPLVNHPAFLASTQSQSFPVRGERTQLETLNLVEERLQEIRIVAESAGLNDGRGVWNAEAEV